MTPDSIIYTQGGQADYNLIIYTQGGQADYTNIILKLCHKHSQNYNNWFHISLLKVLAFERWLTILEK